MGPLSLTRVSMVFRLAECPPNHVDDRIKSGHDGEWGNMGERVQKKGMREGIRPFA